MIKKISILIVLFALAMIANAQTKTTNYPKTLVGRTYIGIGHIAELDQIFSSNFTIHFGTSNKLTLTLEPKLKDGVAEYIVQQIDPQLLEPQTKHLQYTYRNGVVRLVGDSHTTFTIKNGGKSIYWYENKDNNGTFYLKK